MFKLLLLSAREQNPTVLGSNSRVSDAWDRHQHSPRRMGVNRGAKAYYGVNKIKHWVEYWRSN